MTTEENKDLGLSFATVSLIQAEYKNVEWVFQFDDDEPISIGSAMESAIGPKTLTFNIGKKINDNVTFYDYKNNKKFKIFARELKL